MAQLVGHLTLDFHTDLDLKVVGSGPALGSLVGVEPTLQKGEEKQH